MALIWVPFLSSSNTLHLECDIYVCIDRHNNYLTIVSGVLILYLWTFLLTVLQGHQSQIPQHIPFRDSSHCLGQLKNGKMYRTYVLWHEHEEKQWQKKCFKVYTDFKHWLGFGRRMWINFSSCSTAAFVSWNLRKIHCMWHIIYSSCISPPGVITGKPNMYSNCWLFAVDIPVVLEDSSE